MNNNFGISIDGEFLDVSPSSKLSFELRSPAYFPGDEDVLNTSYTTTEQLPRTAKNLKLLTHPERIDSETTFVKNKKCVIYWRGVEIYNGFLNVINYLSVQVTIELNPAFNETSCQDLNLGSFNFGTNPLVTAKDTVINYQNYDAICCPVFNPQISSEEGFDWNNGRLWQNEWQYIPDIPYYNIHHSENFVYNKGLSPFLKLDKAFQKIFASFNLTISQNFFVTPELKSLLLYNNVLLKETNTQWSIPYQNLLPKITVAKFLKGFVRMFNLFIDLDNLEKNVTIYKFDDILNSNPRWDWTNYVIGEPRREALTELLPRSIGFKVEGNWMADKQPEYALNGLPIAEYSGLPAIDLRSANGFYTNINNGLRFWHQRITSGAEGFNGSSKLVMRELLDRSLSYYGGSNTDFEFDISTTLGARVKGPTFNEDIPAATVNCSNDTQFPLNQNTGPNKLFFYRGFRTSSTGYNHPFGSSEIVDYNNAPIKTLGTTDNATIPLKWNGSNGLFETYWRSWWTQLQRGEMIVINLALTPRQLQEFRFSHKVRIDNVNLIAKRIMFSISATSDFALVEAEFIRVF